MSGWPAATVELVGRFPRLGAVRARLAELRLSGDAGHIAFGKIRNPKEFDPEVLRGMSAEEVRANIPADWRHEPSARGEGDVFRDPVHPGRVIRVMPGYPPGARPGLINSGPYVVVSQRSEVQDSAGRKSGTAMNESAVHSLVDEVTDFLRVGSVGLYEFFWILRSDTPELSEDEFGPHASSALGQLLASGTARLVWAVWDDPTYRKPAENVEPSSADWAEPTDKPYLAVVSSDC